MEESETTRKFLEFLDHELKARPELLRPLTMEDVAGLEDLLVGVEVTIDDDIGAFELP